MRALWNGKRHPYDVGMARTPWRPDPQQQHALDQLTRLARRRDSLISETDRMLAQAHAAGIPYSALAEVDGSDWETIKRRLARITKEPTA